MYIKSKKILCASIVAAMILTTGAAPVDAEISYDSTNVGIISQVDEYIASRGDVAIAELTGVAPQVEVAEVPEEKPAEKAPEKKPETKKEKGKYAQFEGKAVAVCETELNIRTKQDADAEVVGYLARYGICNVKEKGAEWTLIESGSCKGYVRTEYLKFGDDAAKWYIDNGFSEVVTINTDTLTVRGEADINSECVTMVGKGESYDILEKGKEWTKIKVNDDLQGYVNNKYIEVGYQTVKAVSVAEQQALIAEEEKNSEETDDEQLKADKDDEAKDAAPEKKEEDTETENSDEAAESNQEKADNTENDNTTYTTSSEEEDTDDDTEDESEDEDTDEDDDDEDDEDTESSDDTDSSENSEPETHYAAPAGQAGQDIVDYALQFVGNPYVWGGTSLTNGADCSGFVQTIYADFGYSISRCADDQVYDGTRVSLSELEPGDLLFYGDDSIGHVAMYIGGGQIVHAAGSSQGIITQNYDYHTPCAAVRIVNQ